MYVGYMCGVVFGDVLLVFLDFVGYDVMCEYYINDGGVQVDVLVCLVYECYCEVNGQEFVICEGLYFGDYLILVGEVLKVKYGDSLLDQFEDVWLVDICDFVISVMMEVICQDLVLLNVYMDVFVSEKVLYGIGWIEVVIDWLCSMDLIYEGVLELLKGKIFEDWELCQQMLFCLISYGDDVDCLVKKLDGVWIYFVFDIVYYWDKIDWGFDQLIDVFGVDYGGYVKCMIVVVKVLLNGCVVLDVKLIQLVKLFKNGEFFKMLKCVGIFVMLCDVVEQVGVDVICFYMLMCKNDVVLDFDFDKVLEQFKDNLVWYV